MDNPNEEGRSAASFQMIRSIQIRHFRCYEAEELRDCGRLNIFVGDNGTGKTSLLEAIFLPLATGSEVAMRLRQQRGLDGLFGGSIRRIEEAAWGDFFYGYNLNQPVELTISGDGPETRSLQIARGTGETTLPLVGVSGAPQPTAASPFAFTWTDAKGVQHSVVPRFTATGVTLP